MNAIYGGMLLHFPELMRPLAYFTQDPLLNSGYENRGTELTTVAVDQSDFSETKDSNGNLVNIDHRRVWIKADIPNGYFARFLGTVYRVVRDAAWPYEGGFFYHELERVVGDNGDTTEEPEFNYGGGNLT